MIDRASIMAWNERAPWTNPEFLGDSDILLRVGAEPFKQWMAQVAAERINQAIDPERSID